MTTAHLWRFLIGFGGGISALALLFITHPFPLAAALAVPVFLLSSLLAERAFRRLATQDAIKRDLEDRVRNPPG
jgi:hypothetical protein